MPAKELFVVCTGLAMVGCAADGAPESLARDLGAPLPAYQTEAEREAKADGWDPRDDYAELYGFTRAPSDDGVLPGEFEPVARVLVGWNDFSAYQTTVVKAAAREAQVSVVTPSYNVRAIESRLARAGVTSNVDFITEEQLGGREPIDSIWIRDYGPLAVRTRDGLRIADLRYYYGRFTDDAFPTRLADALDVPVSRPPIEMEGGNILATGDGTCVTTQWVLNVNEYALGMSQRDVEDVLEQHLGCERSVFLPNLYGEGTGHVDMFVHVTSKTRAIVGDYGSDDRDNDRVVDAAAAQLERAGFTVSRVRMPTNEDGAFRSYTNAVAINGSVLVPVYADDDRFEEDALAVFAREYPDRTIVPVDATEIIQAAGAVHCTTATIPE